MSKNGNRRFRASTDGQWIILEEQEAWIPSGQTRRKWEIRRISITREELAALAAKYPAEPLPPA